MCSCVLQWRQLGVTADDLPDTWASQPSSLPKRLRVGSEFSAEFSQPSSLSEDTTVETHEVPRVDADLNNALEFNPPSRSTVRIARPREPPAVAAIIKIIADQHVPELHQPFEDEVATALSRGKIEYQKILRVWIALTDSFNCTWSQCVKDVQWNLKALVLTAERVISFLQQSCDSLANRNATVLLSAKEMGFQEDWKSLMEMAHFGAYEVSNISRPKCRGPEELRAYQHLIFKAQMDLSSLQSFFDKELETRYVGKPSTSPRATSSRDHGGF